MGPFTFVVGLVLVIGLFGRRAGRGSYATIVLATGAASVWLYWH